MLVPLIRNIRATAVSKKSYRKALHRPQKPQDNPTMLRKNLCTILSTYCCLTLFKIVIDFSPYDECDFFLDRPSNKNEINISVVVEQKILALAQCPSPYQYHK